MLPRFESILLQFPGAIVFVVLESTERAQNLLFGLAVWWGTAVFRKENA